VGVERELALSPSALNDYLACEHLAALEVREAHGDVVRPVRVDPQAELVRRKGEEHELAYLQRLRNEGRTIVEPLDSAATEVAIREDAADVIYQARFEHDGWRGIADFLERQPDGSYEAADTKLARRSKPEHILQLCFYSEQLARIQGRAPVRMHVLLGSGARESFPFADFAAYYRRVRARFEAFVADPPPTYPYPVPHCPICDFLPRCQAQWIADDHLSLVANMRRNQAVRLDGAGITRLDQLATTPPETEIPRMVPSTFEALREQAELQYQERENGGRPLYRLLPLEPERGLALLPKPSSGDLYFDIEGDPFWQPDRGLEYLFGVLTRDGAFHSYWAHDRDAEKRMLEELVDFVHARLRDDPDLHVYHYAAYEPNALKRLMSEYATREDEVDELLRREIFVDLYRVVRQSLRASRPSYSLKELEVFFFRRARLDVTGGGDATVAYELWLETRDDALLGGIEAYNEEDCRATLALHEWLLTLRPDELPWREPPEVRVPKEERVEELAERERLAAELHARGEDLLAYLLDYHRREAKPVWWAFFDRLERTPRELVNDAEAIGELELAEGPEERAQSLVWTFRFPPQEHHFADGDAAFDPATGKGAGWIEQLDNDAGTLRLVRGPSLAEVPLPRALIPGGPYDTRVQQAALMRVARDLERYPALRKILRREPPLGGARVQTDDHLHLVDSLDETYLFVQGPPGSGKTRRGGEWIAHLLARGARVGVSATSHEAIHNLLRAVERTDVSFRGLKRGEEFTSAHIETSDDIADFLDPDVNLVAGTSWLFARPELDRTLDYLVVDEAGQVSLADALAMGTAARNVVLLGDPLQLAQVRVGLHPGGSGASVLEHLLGDEQTVAEDRGLFLERTFRMHPAVCSYISAAFYEDRLVSEEACARQGTSFGTGVRFVPVEHAGNRQSSREEADAVTRELERMLGAEWTDAGGSTRPLREADFLVVAPYNAQVRCLRERVPRGVRVGTVDKFQGQEAPVVFFSMASSSGDDVPRNLEFLFSRNRLNVAVSRARCLAVLVASPRLLEVRCRTVEQMRLANALCLLVERATAGILSV
jgi:uncharacterized protein